jgi:two-component system sensor histidine kinase GlrK
MVRSSFRPRSIFTLILIGFGLTTVPLVAGLIASAIYVDRVTTQGQQAIYHAASGARASESLVEQLTGMERNARQYNVLGDRSLLAVYRNRRKEFTQALGELGALKLDAEQRGLLSRLEANERKLHGQVITLVPGSEAADAVMAEFGPLADDARTIQRFSRQLVVQAVDQLQRAAARAHHLLVWQVSALVPAVLFLAGVFVYRIVVRPLRQLDHSIRQLGSGALDNPVAVSGPRDLEDLGRRLNWMREQLLDLENQKTTFLRHMSHELKTPLASIREGSELLRDEAVGPLTADQREVVELLRQNSLQLQTLITNLLDSSMIGRTSGLSDVRPVRLDALVESVLQNQQLALRGKALQPVTETQRVSVSGDREKLRTLIDNLVSNAIKYSPVRGRLWVRVRREGDLGVVEVEDQGPGVAPTERERIFEPFFQGQSQTAGHVKGTGLGLSIAREYAKLHKGDIYVVDHSGGALFRVTLPTVPADE